MSSCWVGVGCVPDSPPSSAMWPYSARLVISFFSVGACRPFTLAFEVFETSGDLNGLDANEMLSTCGRSIPTLNCCGRPLRGVANSVSDESPCEMLRTSKDHDLLRLALDVR